MSIKGNTVLVGVVSVALGSCWSGNASASVRKHGLPPPVAESPVEPQTPIYVALPTNPDFPWVKGDVPEQPPADPATAALPAPPSEAGRPAGSGQASWYGPGFHGRRTASGEVFNENAYTAAHPSLPLGSRVQVINQRTGQFIVVRINDRGPHVRGRIIDLSRASARAIGMTGTASVRLVNFGE